MTKKPQPATFSGAAPNMSKVLQPSGTAEMAVARLESGCWLVGLTKGQYSLLDLIRAVLKRTGKARVRLSTWSVGIRDAETAAWLIRSDDIESLQLVVDRSFPGRQPAYAGRVTALFGDDAIVVTRVHAKVALIEAGDWRITIRSSMNLNRNPRFEQWDLNDDPELFGFMSAWFDELAESAPRGLTFKEEDAQAAFLAARGGSVTDDELISEVTGGKVEAMPAQVVESQPVQAEVSDSLSVLDCSGLEFQRWLMSEALRGLQASEPGAIAHCNSMREVRTARKALDECRIQMEAEIAAANAPEMTDDEKSQRLSEMVENASDGELEVAVSEWLKRRRYDLCVDGAGALQLVPQGDQRPDLRLVTG